VGNSITSDNILTAAAPKQRKIDDESSDRGQRNKPENRPSATSRDVDLGRGRRRLAGELGGMPDSQLASRDQARELASRLSAQLASDPGSGVKAHLNLDLKLFTAATAPPSA
jgi:hypothetical protein